MGQTRTDDLANILTADALTPVKKSLDLAGHATSVTLEPIFWRQLTAMARDQSVSMNALVASIDRQRPDRSETLAAALRRFVLDSLR